MSLTVELDREVDGRWIAEVTNLPGVMVYGDSEKEAIARVEVLALRVVADQIEHGALSPEAANLRFEFSRARPLTTHEAISGGSRSTLD